MFAQPTLSLCSIAILAGIIGLAVPEVASGQVQYVTFNLSFTYQAHYENSIPAPLLIESHVCTVQNTSLEALYNPNTDDITYSITTRVTAPFNYSIGAAVAIDCYLRVQGAQQGLYIGDFVYLPSSRSIWAELLPDGGYPSPAVTVASLSYIDDFNPSHPVYHFRGSDALFALAQQTFGVNFTGVELLFDVQAPS